MVWRKEEQIKYGLISGVVWIFLRCSLAVYNVG